MQNAQKHRGPRDIQEGTRFYHFETFRLILLKEQSHKKTFAKVYKLKSVTLLKLLMNDPHHASRESYDSID